MTSGPSWQRWLRGDQWKLLGKAPAGYQGTAYIVEELMGSFGPSMVTVGQRLWEHGTLKLSCEGLRAVEIGSPEL